MGKFIAFSTEKNNKVFFIDTDNIDSVTLTEKVVLVRAKSGPEERIETDFKEGISSELVEKFLTGLNQKDETKNENTSDLLQKTVAEQEMEIRRMMAKSKADITSKTLEELEEISEKFHDVINYKLEMGVAYFIDGFECRDILNRIIELKTKAEKEKEMLETIDATIKRDLEKE